jgi:hypothetical protein
MEVDMAFTRKNKILRMRIGCMDARLIPETSDVYISRGFFRLAFEVENKQVDEEVDMVDGVYSNGNNDGDDGGGDDNRKNDGHGKENTNMNFEQTINPGTNQVGMENQRNHASFNQNNLVLTFGSLPSSPITDTVKLPCVFGGKTGSAKDMLMSEKTAVKIVIQLRQQWPFQFWQKTTKILWWPRMIWYWIWCQSLAAPVLPANLRWAVSSSPWQWLSGRQRLRLRRLPRPREHATSRKWPRSAQWLLLCKWWRETSQFAPCGVLRSLWCPELTHN